MLKSKVNMDNIKVINDDRLIFMDQEEILKLQNKLSQVLESQLPELKKEFRRSSVLACSDVSSLCTQTSNPSKYLAKDSELSFSMGNFILLINLMKRRDNLTIDDINNLIDAVRVLFSSRKAVTEIKLDSLVEKILKNQGLPDGFKSELVELINKLIYHTEKSCIEILRRIQEFSGDYCLSFPSYATGISLAMNDFSKGFNREGCILCYDSQPIVRDKEEYILLQNNLEANLLHIIEELNGALKRSNLPTISIEDNMDNFNLRAFLATILKQCDDSIELLKTRETAKKLDTVSNVDLTTENEINMGM